MLPVSFQQPLFEISLELKQCLHALAHRTPGEIIEIEIDLTPLK